MFGFLTTIVDTMSNAWSSTWSFITGEDDTTKAHEVIAHNVVTKH
jgi:hypothetical protein